jgi:hypothetical protein
MSPQGFYWMSHPAVASVIAMQQHFCCCVSSTSQPIRSNMVDTPPSTVVHFLVIFHLSELGYEFDICLASNVKLVYFS